MKRAKKKTRFDSSVFSHIMAHMLRGFFTLILSAGLLFSQAAQASTEAGVQALRAGDFVTAYGNLVPAATAGDAVAQFSMCGMYFQGQGVPQNPYEAFKWCELATNNGHLEATYNLALFYQKGSGVGQNINQAMKYYQIAAERGHKDAQFNLLQLYNANLADGQKQNAGGGKLAGIVPPVGIPLDANGNPANMNPLKIAPAAVAAVPTQIPAQIPAQVPMQQVAAPVEQVRQAAIPQLPPQPAPPPPTLSEQQLSSFQQACLQAAQQGIIAENCGSSKAIDFAQSAPTQQAVDVQNTIGWFEKQAELGDLGAQNNLGVMYRRGTGVAKNPEKAFTLFEKSAARGSPKGMLNLANMYKLGEGTEQNLELSYAWYNLAADRIPAGEMKQSALKNIKEISAHMDNAQIGSALEYVTKLDETIPLAE